MSTPKIRAILVAIVVIIAILLIVAIPRIRRHETELEGLWVGDPTFTKKAGLSELYMLLDPQDKQTIPGYLVMLDDKGGEVYDNDFELSYASPFSRITQAISGHMSNAPLTSDAFFFGDEDAPEKNPWPDRVTITHDETKGTLTVRSQDKLLAVFVQDREASNLS
jgi:hypothetical protein